MIGATLIDSGGSGAASPRLSTTCEHYLGMHVHVSCTDILHAQALLCTSWMQNRDEVTMALGA